MPPVFEETPGFCAPFTQLWDACDFFLQPRPRTKPALFHRYIAHPKNQSLVTSAATKRRLRNIDLRFHRIQRAIRPAIRGHRLKIAAQDFQRKKFAVDLAPRPYAE